MRKLTLTAFLTLLTILTVHTAQANDIDVYNITEQNYNSSASPKTLDIKFDLTWKNSYTGTDANNASYWDRAWVFVKYIKSTNLGGTNNVAWKHATLYKSGTSGTNTGAYSSTNGVGVSADQKGVFCKPGMNQIIRWNIGTDEAGVVSTDTYKVRVFAIEMVLVPTGPFYIGDGNGTSESANAFHVTDNTYVPAINATTAVSGIKTDYHATYPDDAILGGTDASTPGAGITVGGPAGSYTTPASTVAGNGVSDGDTVSNGSFPTGYNGFYIMKYELSQGQYVDFLNTLTREQQTNRIGTIIATTATSVTNIYVMSNTATVSYRNTITCPSAITASVPITFSTTTPCRACNWTCWADLCAYADWSGLRPMTELEFEKACRGGNIIPVYGEFAWGTTTIAKALISTTNDGTPLESPTNLGIAGICVWGNAIGGSVRCGFTASSSTTRTNSGASYYGAMDLSGNDLERCVTVGNPTGRLFDGAHGDGTLSTSTGNANGATLQYWPGYVSGEILSPSASGYNAVGSGYRGGSWADDSSLVRTSDRYYAAYVYANRSFNYGIRCVRTEGS